MGYVFAFILGVAAATIGFTGVAKLADSGVKKVQQTVIKMEKGD